MKSDVSVGSFAVTSISYESCLIYFLSGLSNQYKVDRFSCLMFSFRLQLAIWEIVNYKCEEISSKIMIYLVYTRSGT